MITHITLSSLDYQNRQNHEDKKEEVASELINRVEGFFHTFVKLIQEIEIKELPLLPAEVDYVEKLILDFNLLDPRLKPTRDVLKDSPLHPKVQSFRDKFSVIPLKEKILLTQRLFNASYELREIYYFLPSLLISQIYPKLKTYINFRDSKVERILASEGIRFAIDQRKSCRKLSSTIICEPCENIQKFKDEMQKVKETSEDMQKLFFLQMDDTESLEGDHTVPIFIKKSFKEGRLMTEVVITDSVGKAKKFLDTTACLTHQLLPESDIKGFALPRQINSHSCFIIALNDAQVIAEDPETFIDFIRSQECEEIPDSPYKVFYLLPDKMMKFTQTHSTLKAMDSHLFEKLSQKAILINKENPVATSFIDVWKQKGLLITDTQLSKPLLNVSANQLFAKIESKILENIFNLRGLIS